MRGAEQEVERVGRAEDGVPDQVGQGREQEQRDADHGGAVAVRDGRQAGAPVRSVRADQQVGDPGGDGDVTGVEDQVPPGEGRLGAVGRGGVHGEDEAAEEPGRGRGGEEVVPPGREQAGVP